MSTLESTAPWGAGVGARARLRRWLESRAVRWALWSAPVLALTVFAAWHRLRALGAPLWVDEGISLGISSHPLSAIPHVLREDGSPPLYYVLLHVWTGAFGATPSSGHRLSAVCAVLAVPASAWAAWRPWGPLAGVLAAALAAFSPFLGLYADELRMYSLTFLLAALATGAFARAFVIGSRRWAIGFGVLVAALMLTHNWGAFFAISSGVAYLAVVALSPGDRRRTLLVDGAIAVAIVAALYAAWIPTLAFQSTHTGAPWSHVPHLSSLGLSFARMLSGVRAEVVLLAVGALGLALTLWRGERTQRLAFGTALVLALGTLLGGWATSRFGTPAWASRYHTIVLGALVVPIAAGLARLRLAGVVAAALVCIPLWGLKPATRTLDIKSNVAPLAAHFAGRLPLGTLVVATQADEVPVLRYYLGAGYRYLTPLGMQRDDRVVDWIDALARARAASIDRTLAPGVAALQPGQRLLLAGAKFHEPDAPWTRLAYRIDIAWSAWLDRRPDLRLIGAYRPHRFYSRSTVYGLLFEKLAPARRRR